MTLQLPSPIHLAAALALGLLSACGPQGSDPTGGSGSETDNACTPGSEGCECDPGGGCESGLQCMEGMCIPLNGGTNTTGTTTTESTGDPTSTTLPDPTTTTDDTSDYTDSCGFIGCIGDMGGSFECDVWSQDCEEGMKCAAWDQDGDGAWDSTKCVDVMGNGQHGDPCTVENGASSGNDDCDVGVMCWNVNEENVGTCVELCTGSPEAPNCGPPNTFCVIANMGSLNLCLPGCDPLLQDCGQADVCIADPMGEGFVCVLDASGGMAPEGTPCEFANVCNPGLFCASPDFYTDPNCADSLGCCAPFCDLTDPDACMGLLNDMAECVAWYEMGQAPPQWVDVGGCGIPG